MLRHAADVMHLLALLMLSGRVCNANINGVSVRTQQLYLLVFTTRYVDISWWNGVVNFNFVMKVLFLIVSLIICVRLHSLRKYYNHHLDEARRMPLVLISAVVSGAWVWYYQDFLQLLWFQFLYTFSFALESIAILPQLQITKHKGRVDPLMSNYMLLLCLYRLLYIAHWFTTPNRTDSIIKCLCFVHVCLFADFVYYYIRSRRRGERDTVLDDDIV